jgi:hypothetical protein
LIHGQLETSEVRSRRNSVAGWIRSTLPGMVPAWPGANPQDSVRLNGRWPELDQVGVDMSVRELTRCSRVLGPER